MTGFGRVVKNFEWGTVMAEISSVNHRYQDFSVKLPRELAILENRLLNSMRKLITRGKVKLNIEINLNSGANIPFVDERAFLNFYDHAEKIALLNNLSISRDINNFLMVPGIVSENNLALEITEANPEILEEILQNVINDMLDMKKSEGEKIYNLIANDLNIFENIIKNISLRWEIAKDEAIENLRSRIENVTQKYNLEIDQNRIAQEISLMSDKWDISEELSRSLAHIEKFKIIMDAEQSSGKKIDFLIQEMNREINTIGSKAADAEIRWNVVEAKSILEKIREQIQNIE